jgi:hypothetical protein
MLLEARLGVNALSTQFLQVNSDSLIVATGLGVSFQLKCSARGAQQLEEQFSNERNVLSTRIWPIIGAASNLIEPKVG